MLRTLKNFPTMSDLDLSKGLGKNVTGFTGNLDLTAPPVPPVDLKALQDAFNQAITDAFKGGTIMTAKKNLLRAQIIVAMSKNASYVDMACEENLVILLSSGYQAVSTNRAPAQLETVQVVSTSNEIKGQLKARVKVDPNTRSIVGHIKALADAAYGPDITFASTKKIIFKNLTGGMTYSYELMAVGGSTGQSNWSTPAQGMAQ